MESVRGCHYLRNSLCGLKNHLKINSMKITKQRKNNIYRKKLIDEYHVSLKSHAKDLELFEKLVIKKNEYYDQLTTEDAVLSALEKFDLPDGK